MKKLTILTTLIFLIAGVAAAQNNAPKTINEYFLEIPSEYIKSDTRQRALWIDEDNAKQGYLAFTIPAAQILDEDEDLDATIFGEAQLFNKDKGGVIVGLTINICAENKCAGQMLLLDYNNGNWKNVTDTLAPEIDTDEVYNILKESPAYGKPIEKDEEIPMAIQLNGEERSIHYLANCKVSFDGGVIVKMFKWNGKSFVEFEYEMSP